MLTLKKLWLERCMVFGMAFNCVALKSIKNQWYFADASSGCVVACSSAMGSYVFNGQQDAVATARASRPRGRQGIPDLCFAAARGEAFGESALF
ncbi:hypothetical protein [Chromobacterium haemolyticum]|uniref:hypothetical protein n=1 Tax=Chromobacterium haemolyticum TaxID=394935 RepID=UPI001130F83D|nr:hypothetical protein [Chromobacterium haemolyticum]